MRKLVLVVLLVACGDDGGNSVPIDGSVDAPPDAPPDAAIDAPVVPASHTRYVIDAFQVPTTNNEARMYGLDLDGDGVVDNQLGMVLATLTGQGFDTDAATAEAVATGASITLVDLESAGLVDAVGSKLALFEGQNPSPPPCAGAGDTICRKHLAGTATFTAAATPVHPPLEGAFVAGTLTAGPGTITLPLAMTGPTAPVRVELIGARVKLSAVTTTTIGSAIIAGAMTQTEIDTKLLPAMHLAFMAQVSADCTQLANPPSCGCASSSTGLTLLNLFDTTPQDCEITLAEVQNNTLIQSLLAPDVMINGTPALSLGMGATAVHAEFVTP